VPCHQLFHRLPCPALLAGLLSLVLSVPPAAAVNLPQTGQGTCSDTAGNPIACAGTGQDGEQRAGVAWPQPRFVDNGDGTVTDRLTGLVWLQNGNLFGPGSRMELEDAFFNLARMNSGQIVNFGYTDWRIPNINELESLLNLGVADPAAWLNGQGFTDIQPGPWFYWSATAAAGYNGTLAWALRFGDGVTQTLPISGTENGRNHFWAVRGGQAGAADTGFPANVWRTGQTTAYVLGDDGNLQRGVAWPTPRFGDNGDGTITDNLTGLVWLQDASCMANHYPAFDVDPTVGDGGVVWSRALAFVAGINQGQFPNCSGGRNDWRLPNLKELRSLVDYGRLNPPLPADNLFTSTVGPTTFWSSDSHVANPRYAWFVDFVAGTTGYQLKSGVIDFPFYGVLPVRGGAIDSDGDGVFDTVEQQSGCMLANDADTDDDGLGDGVEDANANGAVDAGETSPCVADSDGDGLLDGTERGLTAADIGADTDPAVFVADADPATTTDPLAADSDRDCIDDGIEDANRNGRIDDGESDPGRGNVESLLPVLQLLFEE
jgi:hypothetical protein